MTRFDEDLNRREVPDFSTFRTSAVGTTVALMEVIASGGRVRAKRQVCQLKALQGWK